jgi:thiol-disulfide isomerase/thioredoxin
VEASASIAAALVGGAVAGVALCDSYSDVDLDPTYLPNLFKGKTLFSKFGESAIPPHQFEGRTMALYFNMSTCPDCRQMTPKLEEACSKMPFGSVEIVCVSSEANMVKQWEFVRTLRLPWLAIPLNDPLTMELKRRFRTFAGSEQDEVGTPRKAGIPALYVSKDGGKTWSGPLNETASVEDISTALK